MHLPWIWCLSNALSPTGLRYWTHQKSVPMHWICLISLEEVNAYLLTSNQSTSYLHNELVDHIFLPQQISMYILSLHTYSLKYGVVLLHPLCNNTTKKKQLVTCYHKISVKSLVCLQRNSLLIMPQNNRKQMKITTKYCFLLDKIRCYTHISYIILKLALWKISICNNLE